jgi:hypothetical protein
MTQDSTVHTVTRLRAGQSGVQMLAEAKELSLFLNIQASSGAYTASYPVGIRGSFPVLQAAGAEG